MLERFYKYQGDGQLELFPLERKSPWRYAVIGIIAGILLIGMVALAKAEEPNMVYRGGGILCDTEAQLDQWLDNINTKGELTAPVEGCGGIEVHPIMVMQFGGLPAHATPLKVRDNAYATDIRIVQFDFTVTPFGANLGTQYGWVGFTTRPPSQDI